MSAETDNVITENLLRTVPLDGRPFIDLCGSGFRANKMTGILLLWLTQHFSNTDYIVEPGVKNRIWTTNPETSKIQILAHDDWKPQTTEQRPALLVKRNEQKFVRYGIDNRLMGGGPPYETRRIHVSAMQGSHTVFCIAGEGGEAEQLAAEVSQDLMKFAPIVREWLNMLRVELVSIGKMSKLEEGSENFAVPIDIAYAYLEEWELFPQDTPILTEIKGILGYL
jgi:hypothetical protein